MTINIFVDLLIGILGSLIAAGIISFFKWIINKCKNDRHSPKHGH